jgi:hypothetical protein
MTELTATRSVGYDILLLSRVRLLLAVLRNSIENGISSGSLEVEDSPMGLVGLALSVFVDQRLLVLPGVVSAMVFLYATQGWYPLLAIFRRLGLGSRNEIDRERYALKALRGDFSNVGSTGSQ